MERRSQDRQYRHRAACKASATVITAGTPDRLSSAYGTRGPSNIATILPAIENASEVLAAAWDLVHASDFSTYWLSLMLRTLSMSPLFYSGIVVAKLDNPITTHTTRRAATALLPLLRTRRLEPYFHMAGIGCLGNWPVLTSENVAIYAQLSAASLTSRLPNLRQVSAHHVRLLPCLDFKGRPSCCEPTEENSRCKDSPGAAISWNKATGTFAAGPHVAFFNPP